MTDNGEARPLVDPMLVTAVQNHRYERRIKRWVITLLASTVALIAAVPVLSLLLQSWAPLALGVLALLALMIAAVIHIALHPGRPDRV